MAKQEHVEPPQTRRQYDAYPVTHDHRERDHLVVATGDMLRLKRRNHDVDTCSPRTARAHRPLANTRALHALPADLPPFLALTVGVAVLGWLWPPLLEAVVGFPLLNYNPTPPVSAVDRGPGVQDELNVQIFAPFQRLGDLPAGNGTGPGRAVAHGQVQAMGGSLTADDVPGRALTMVLNLPTAAAPPPIPPAEADT